MKATETEYAELLTEATELFIAGLNPHRAAGMTSAEREWFRFRDRVIAQHGSATFTRLCSQIRRTLIADVPHIVDVRPSSPADDDNWECPVRF